MLKCSIVAVVAAIHPDCKVTRNLGHAISLVKEVTTVGSPDSEPLEMRKTPLGIVYRKANYRLVLYKITMSRVAAFVDTRANDR